MCSLLNNEFIKKKSIKEYTVAEKFYSKKNDVYKIRSISKDGKKIHYVVKVFKGRNGKKRLSNENYMLKVLKEQGLAVPTLYFRDNNSLTMEYISGQTFLDLICSQENLLEENMNNNKSDKKIGINLKSSYNILFSICKYLSDFNSISKKVYGKSIILKDMSLRNFIIKDRVFRVDFEDCHEGIIEEDGGRLCAFTLTYDPIFTSYKINFAKELFDIMKGKFSFDGDILRDQILSELAAIRKRRKIKISQKMINIALPDL